LNASNWSDAGFAVVKLATERATGAEYAVKIMALPEKGRVVGNNENTRDDIFKEIDILVGLNHPNVIYLKEYFEENKKVPVMLARRMKIFNQSSINVHYARLSMLFEVLTSRNILCHHCRCTSSQSS
jgi:serine/threonine protein kinase